MSDTAILVPVLGRPHLVEPLLDSIYSTEPGITVLFIVTNTDHEGLAGVRNANADYITIRHKVVGDYAYKINAGYRETTEKYLFLGATDLRFHPNWLTNAKSRLSDTIHVVGTNDLGHGAVMAGEHSTHSLVTRYYCDTFGTIDEPGKVLHEGYIHEFVDDEFIETARRRNAFAMALDSHVEHMHPAWGKAPWDASYAEVHNRMGPSRELFFSRRMLWM